MSWAGFVVRIGIGGGVTLRRPSGEAIAWATPSEGQTDDQLAKRWLEIFQGAQLEDKRRPAVCTGRAQ